MNKRTPSVKEIVCSIKQGQEVHSYNSRNRHLLELRKIRLQKKSSHIYVKTQLFNKLPQKAWSVPFINFKTVLEKWLKENN